MGMVWKMMKAFGEKNKVHKNYIFYFEVSAWSHMLIVTGSNNRAEMIIMWHIKYL